VTAAPAAAPVAVAAGQQADVQRARRHTAHVALFLLGIDVSASAGLSTGLLVGLALIPVWVPALRRFRGATTLLALGLVAIVAGWALTLTSTERDVDLFNATAVSLQMVTALTGVGLILWSRQVLPLQRIALVLGLGALASAILKSPGSDNAWKYELAVPVTVVLLALLRPASKWALAGVLAALAAVGVLNDHRSYLGFCIATLGLVLWQARPDHGRRIAAPYQVLFLGLFAYLVYRLGEALLLSGALGYDLQQRTITQIRHGGSLILGGRPEWEATAKLLRADPQGFGVGAVPRSGDVSLAKQGLVQVGVPVKNGYVERYMFGGEFKLHSVVADLWSNFGVAGFVLGLAIGLVLLLALTSALAARKAAPVVVFLVLNALWNLPFGPLYSSLPVLIPALGLVMLPRTADAELNPG
jgi:hypothetical protein